MANLVATGFLRMGIDETGSRTMNFAENRIGVIADAINVLGSGVMGLTMDCVRCHSQGNNVSDTGTAHMPWFPLP